jgi:hypothetical protein
VLRLTKKSLRRSQLLDGYLGEGWRNGWHNRERALLGPRLTSAAPFMYHRPNHGRKRAGGSAFPNCRSSYVSVVFHLATLIAPSAPSILTAPSMFVLWYIHKDVLILHIGACSKCERILISTIG